MSPDHLAALHARAFSRPPPWSAMSFARTLADPACFLCHRPGAFLLARAVADEAELLTLATDPAHRRQGLARTLLADFAAQAQARGAVLAFLEVAEGNAPARALYAADGWVQVGRRRDYLGPGQDALVLKRVFAQRRGSADPVPPGP